MGRTDEKETDRSTFCGGARGTVAGSRSRLLRSLTVVLFLVVLVAGGRAAAEAGNNRGVQSQGSILSTSARAVEDKIVRYTNEERRRRNLRPLRKSPALVYLARRHSANICATKRFEHESSRFPRGWRRFATRLNLVGLQTGGENIGYQSLVGDPDRWAKRMVKGWMRSPSHRRNILDPRFRYMGVGVVPCDNDIGYAAEVFSHGRGRLPVREFARRK